LILLDLAAIGNYNVIMKASIIQIGNSRGVRIPKAFLEQAGLHEDVEIEVRGSQIVVQASRRAREGWDEAFRSMAARGDDALLDRGAPALTRWDEREWEW
jgi:antitoxin MazE